MKKKKLVYFTVRFLVALSAAAAVAIFLQGCGGADFAEVLPAEFAEFGSMSFDELVAKGTELDYDDEEIHADEAYLIYTIALKAKSPFFARKKLVALFFDDRFSDSFKISLLTACDAEGVLFDPEKLRPLLDDPNVSAGLKTHVRAVLGELRYDLTTRPSAKPVS